LVTEVGDPDISLITRGDRIDRVQVPTDLSNGIGTLVSVRGGADPRLMILDVIPGSPAEAAGLAEREAILEINGEPIDPDIPLEETVGLLRGEPGSEVVLKVRSSLSGERVVSVERGEIRAGGRDLRWTYLEESNTLDVLFSPREPADIGNQFLGILQQVLDRGTLGGLILDMRVANTGPTSSMSGILPLFTNGPVAFNVGRDDRTPITITAEFSIFEDPQSLPLVILVGPETQGTPELVAGVLQDSGRAVLLGQPTPGDVEGVSSYYLPNGTQMVLPITSVETAIQGNDIGADGLTPDLELSTDWDESTYTADPVIEAAQEFILLIQRQTVPGGGEG
ncbi:MAG: S41 family peptidase, partial [Chloroflexota bacterium]